jgi:hypothetical protein
VSAVLSGSQALWLVSRASGLAVLAGFSAAVVADVAARLGPGGRFRLAAGELHRTLALFCVAFLGLHVATAILDPYVRIGWAATVLPLASPYRTLAIGLGALTVDLGGAVLVTSLVRQRLGYRPRRNVPGQDRCGHGLAPGLACRALAGLPGLARGAVARGHSRQRPADLVGHAGAVGVHRDGRHGGDRPPAVLAAWARLAGQGAPVTGTRLARTRPRLLSPGPAGLIQHTARYGPPPSGLSRPQRQALIAEVDRAGLTGRGGGAGFPTSRKLAAVAAGHVPVVVANGTEGEPASIKDRVLMARSPHLVLDGAVLAAELTGAGRAVIVAHRDVREIVDEAAAERAGPAWTGSGSRSAPRRTGSWPAKPARSCTGSSGASPRPPRPRRDSRNAACAAHRRWCRTWRRSLSSRSSPVTAPPGSAPPGRQLSPAPAGHRVRRGA